MQLLRGNEIYTRIANDSLRGLGPQLGKVVVFHTQLTVETQFPFEQIDAYMVNVICSKSFWKKLAARLL